MTSGPRGPGRVSAAPGPRGPGVSPCGAVLREDGAGRTRQLSRPAPLGQDVLQLTEGQVHVPLGEIVTLKLLPLPFGVAFMTY